MATLKYLLVTVKTFLFNWINSIFVPSVINLFSCYVIRFSYISCGGQSKMKRQGPLLKNP